MEKNYRLQIGHNYDQTPQVDEYFETLGHAMIRIKTYGEEQRTLDKCPFEVAWQIADYTDNEQGNDLDVVGGKYNEGWEPIIQTMITFE